MEVILKQRLIGAAVIIALAVVLIPMVLDSAGKHERAGIPDTPGYVATHKSGQIRIVHTSVPKPGSFNPADFSYSGRNNRADRAARSASEGVKPKAVKRRISKRVAQAPVTRTRQNDGARHSGGAGSSKLKPVTRLDLGKSAQPKRARPDSQPVKRSAVKRKTEDRTMASTPARQLQTRANTRQVEQPKQSDQQGLKTWTVQVASFRNRNNAYLLKAKLHKAGFRAYIQRLEAKNRKSVYRVRVGPEKNHNKAREVLARLRREVRMNGYITKY